MGNRTEVSSLGMSYITTFKEKSDYGIVHAQNGIQIKNASVWPSAGDRSGTLNN